jgi:hypothetical protein
VSALMLTGRLRSLVFGEICHSTDQRKAYFHGKFTASEVGSTAVNVTVGRRSREYLTEWEAERSFPPYGEAFQRNARPDFVNLYAPRSSVETGTVIPLRAGTTATANVGS